RGGVRELVAEGRARTELALRLGVGPNRLIAKVASDLEKPRGFVAMGREEACRGLPRALRPPTPAIGPKTAERLGSLGYTTIGSLQRAPEEELIARFGTRHARE